MKMPVIVFCGVVLAFLPASTAAGTWETPLRLEQYGVELTLPMRWELMDLTEKYVPAPEGESAPLLLAQDDRQRANIELFAMKPKEDISIDEWAEGMIPGYLDKYSSPYGYDSASPEYREAEVSPGLAVNIIYYRLHYVLPFDRQRSVAFVYFEHAGYYFYMFVYNRRFYPLEWELEKTILPGLRLFEPSSE
jgi:hypothetical protein